MLRVSYNITSSPPSDDEALRASSLLSSLRLLTLIDGMTLFLPFYFLLVWSFLIPCPVARHGKYSTRLLCRQRYRLAKQFEGIQFRMNCFTVLFSDLFFDRLFDYLSHCCLFARFPLLNACHFNCLFPVLLHTVCSHKLHVFFHFITLRTRHREHSLRVRCCPRCDFATQHGGV